MGRLAKLLKQNRNNTTLSQRELARRAGVSSSLIKHAEYGREYPKIENLAKIAPHLGKTLDELVDASFEDQGVSRKRFPQGQETSSRLTSEVQSARPPTRGELPSGHVQQSQDSTIIAPPTAKDLLQEASLLSSQGLWLPAEEKALQALEMCRKDSEESAKITLRFCAPMRQQAGDARKAKSHIRSVEKGYLKVAGRPNPRIEALVKNKLAWIYDEQWGYFTEAHKLATQSLLFAR